ncbi:GNAT family acetyltransferase [Sphingosinicella sp. CPCC 101087]|uniref:GNAT family acetyltransferase n=1 Tax=Sphingosinicella sp. CPCC 101087 TaxID=2497754 RepID=UPI00101CB416|nr:GNAT family acetyltransferase [Sphingosinicella sp. CPCC 101087]
MIRVEAYRPEMETQVDALWREAFPDDPPRNRAAVAIPAKLAFQPDLLLVATEDGAVVGTVMAGYDGHRGWLYAVAVRRSHRRRGIGRTLIGEAEERLAKIGCTKINLQVRATNEAVVGFYRDLGYAVEERISMGKAVGS